jgi:hypothetical protein
VPAGQPIADRLRGVVRKGQTSFQFATIYEQRRTNQILIAGFVTLGDALERLRTQIANDLGDLQTRLDELIQFQNTGRSRPEEEEYLRDIQRRRRPAS